jgi:hypothetical protein
MSSVTADQERISPANAQPLTGLARLALVVVATIGLWAFDTFLDPDWAGTLGPILIVIVSLGVVISSRADARSGVQHPLHNRARFRRVAPLVLLALLAVAVILKMALHTEAPLGAAALVDTEFILGALPMYLTEKVPGTSSSRHE